MGIILVGALVIIALRPQIFDELMGRGYHGSQPPVGGGGGRVVQNPPGAALGAYQQTPNGILINPPIGAGYSAYGPGRGAPPATGGSGPGIDYGAVASAGAGIISKIGDWISNSRTGAAGGTAGPQGSAQSDLGSASSDDIFQSARQMTGFEFGPTVPGDNITDQPAGWSDPWADDRNLQVDAASGTTGWDNPTGDQPTEVGFWESAPDNSGGDPWDYV